MHHPNNPPTVSKKSQLDEFKQTLHAEMQDATLALMPRYFEMLQETQDPEELRKGLAFFVQTVGAEAEKKTDPYGNLPIVQITFNNGAMQATAVAAPVIELTQEQAVLLAPSPAMADNVSINADVDLD